MFVLNHNYHKSYFRTKILKFSFPLQANVKYSVLHIDDPIKNYSFQIKQFFNQTIGLGQRINIEVFLLFSSF
jgi:hypothetical protein